MARLVDRDGSLVDLVVEEYLMSRGTPTGLSVEVDIDAAVGGTHSLHLPCSFAEVKDLRSWLHEVARGVLVEPLSLAEGSLWLDCVQDGEPLIVLRFAAGEAHLRPTLKQIQDCVEALDADLMAFPE